jgi:transposase
VLNFSPAVRIFLATNPVDMRRQIDGLAALVSDVLSQDPFTGHVFVFRGRRADRVKVLVWDKNGFVLYYKRLEKSRFRFPDAAAGCRELDSTALTLLLEGLDLELAARAPRWYPARGSSARPPAPPDPA